MGCPEHAKTRVPPAPPFRQRLPAGAQAKNRQRAFPRKRGRKEPFPRRRKTGGRSSGACSCPNTFCTVPTQESHRGPAQSRGPGPQQDVALIRQTPMPALRRKGPAGPEQSVFAASPRPLSSARPKKRSRSIAPTPDARPARLRSLPSASNSSHHTSWPKGCME